MAKNTCIELEGVTDQVLDGLTITGGNDCIRLVNCRRCKIQNCVLADPLGPPDPHGHCVILDKCEDCEVSNNTCTATKPGVEDHINLFNCKNCRVLNNTIEGHGVTDSGTGICIDGWDTAGCIAAGNKIRNAGQVGIMVAGGCKHTIKGNYILDCNMLPKFPDAGNVCIGVMSCYPEQSPKVKSITISGNVISNAKGSDIWIDPATTAKIKQNKNVTGTKARSRLLKLWTK